MLLSWIVAYRAIPYTLHFFSLRSFYRSWQVYLRWFPNFLIKQSAESNLMVISILFYLFCSCEKRFDVLTRTFSSSKLHYLAYAFVVWKSGSINLRLELFPTDVFIYICFGFHHFLSTPIICRLILFNICFLQILFLTRNRLFCWWKYSIFVLHGLPYSHF